MRIRRNLWSSGENYTLRALEEFHQAVDTPSFRYREQTIIYQTLTEKLKIVSFGDYLRRYIYEKAGLTEPFSQVPVSVYQSILGNEFHDRFTPCSFTPTTARLSNVCKNWLTQGVVSRQVVLLLGFGLGMTVGDVNDFLTKACQEPILDPKDPQEVLCWYCYRYGLNFVQYQDLWAQYEQLPPREELPDDDNPTTVMRSHLGDVSTRAQLMEYLSRLKTADGQSRQGTSAARTFQMLYDKARQCVAEWLTGVEEENASLRRERLQQELSRNDRLYDFEKKQLLDKVGRFRRYEKDDITPADIESVLLAAVPKGSGGNLLPMKSSALNQQFRGRRLSRQRLSELLNGKTPVSRYDLITLRFFVYAQTFDPKAPSNLRFHTFAQKANRMLVRCSLRPLYIANPYECFLLMCLLTDDPLGSYADVWELSYEKEA